VKAPAVRNEGGQGGVPNDATSRQNETVEVPRASLIVRCRVRGSQPRGRPIRR